MGPVLDQFGEVMAVPGMTPTEDLYDTQGTQFASQGPVGPTTDANGQYTDPVVGYINPTPFSSVTLTQFQWVAYQGTSFPVGAVTWTISSPIFSPATITGTNGVSGTYQTPLY
jgi:hypothetical protein